MDEFSTILYIEVKEQSERYPEKQIAGEERLRGLNFFSLQTKHIPPSNICNGVYNGVYN